MGSFRDYHRKEADAGAGSVEDVEAKRGRRGSVEDVEAEAYCMTWKRDAGGAAELQQEPQPEPPGAEQATFL